MSDVSDDAEIAVIVGPTAAGKSEVALRLAERYGRDIIVADSRQVYRGFDIGTAKPTAAQQGSVRHVAIDLADPTERYSAAQWNAVAERQLEHASAGSIVVGGTGLYLRALFDGLFDEPDLHPARRRPLLHWLDGQPTGELRRWVSQLDPGRAGLGRTQLLRAIEVALLTGTRISELHATRATVPRWRARYLVIDPGPALHGRIANRFDAMIDAGWLEEVRALRSVPDDAPAWKSSGYRTLRDAVDGTLSLDEARKRILIETRQYAKRQRTWFRHQLPEDRTTRFNPETDQLAEIDRWFNSIRA